MREREREKLIQIGFIKTEQYEEEKALLHEWTTPLDLTPLQIFCLKYVLIKPLFLPSFLPSLPPSLLPSFPPFFLFLFYWSWQDNLPFHCSRETQDEYIVVIAEPILRYLRVLPMRGKRALCWWNSSNLQTKQIFCFSLKPCAIGCASCVTCLLGFAARTARRESYGERSHTLSTASLQIKCP